MKDAFAKLLDNLADLIKVKTLVTFAMVFTVCWMTMKGTVETGAFLTMAGAVITYYFTKPEKDRNSKDD